MQEKLRQLQLVQLEILKKIDHFCKEHGLHYSLYAGTLLGAVRHQGFIPWDDDLDICMARDEYNKFIELWKKYSPKDYIIQNKETDRKFSQSFTKIRKDHTSFLQKGEIKGEYHQGIFVDVFPIDRMPNGYIKRKIFTWNCLKYQVLTREFIPPKGSYIQRLISKLILIATPKSKRMLARECLLNKICRYNADQRLNTVAIEILKTIVSPLPQNFMTEFIQIKFEDTEFMCSANYKEYLTIKFGDYMKLPPESEREWRHHPVILDFEHNVDEVN